MNPRVREDQYEPMAFAFLRNLGLLSPKFFYVDLTVNGQRIGVMAVEEYPAKEFLESQGRRESVILRFDESMVWDDFAHKGYWDDNFSNYMTTPIRVAQQGKVAKSPKLSRDLKVAAGLLKSYVRGVLPASQVFDVEEYARFLAALEVLEARNGLWWANLRFYYNPISARLEPVGSDLMSESRNIHVSNLFHLHSMTYNETRNILADPEIREAFVHELQRLVKDVENGSTEAFLKPLDEKYLAALHRDIPILKPFDFDRMKRRAEHLSKVTVENLDYFNHLEDIGHSSLINAQEIRTGPNGRLELTNIIEAPVEVISISWRSNSEDSSTPFRAMSPIEYPLELEATDLDRKPDVVDIPFIYPPDIVAGSQIEVVAKIKGTTRTYLATGSQNFSALVQRPIPGESLSLMLDRHRFLRQVNDSTLSVQPGNHIVAETISIPSGYELQIPAGTTLLFAPDASLIIRGALNMSGTANQPVVLDGQEISDGDKVPGWRGIVVLNARQPSLWRHVRIRNTTGITHGDWELTGGVTFYESKVQLEKVYFEASRAEDALNIVRSDFELKGVIIKDTISDGFDSDFSSGSVEGGIFENIGIAGGGDAIDISGSVVSVNGTRFVQISDKALSVGEGSQMTASNVQIDGAMTGAASKDASRLEISSSTISNAQIAGMMAYVKKPEYGPASIDAVEVQVVGTSSNAMVQKGSEIKIDGKVVPPDNLDVDKLYDSFMKKASR